MSRRARAAASVSDTDKKKGSSLNSSDDSDASDSAEDDVEVGSSSSSKSKRPKRVSTSWLKHVFTREKEPNASGKTLYKCLFHRFAVGFHSEKIASSGDGNLMKHFKTCHPDAHARLSQTAADGIAVGPVVEELLRNEEKKRQDTGMSKFLRQADVRRSKVVSACLWSVVCGVSQSSLDHPLFKHFLAQTGQAENAIYSRTQREKRVLPAIYEAVRNSRDTELQNLKSKFFSCTTDSWTSFDHTR